MGLLKTVFEVNLSLFGGSAEQHAEGLSTRYVLKVLGIGR